MEVIYQGVDITEFVVISGCIVRDTCGCRCDSLDIEFENAAGWYGWQPAEDDVLVVRQDGYDSGTMYLNTILPEGGKYRIYATALPCSARAKGYESYAGNTIDEIMSKCAAKTGMGYATYGMDGNAVIPYIERNDESCAGLLGKLMMLEGAVLKCVNGLYTGIDILAAQDRDVFQTFVIKADPQDARYSRSGSTFRRVTIKTPYAQASAEDLSVPVAHMALVTGKYPALDAMQAGRWARGKLLHINRQCESVEISMAFNPGLTAMQRVDITGGTDADGEWLVEDVSHDLINLSSVATLRRCIHSIR